MVDRQLQPQITKPDKHIFSTSHEVVSCNAQTVQKLDTQKLVASLSTQSAHYSSKFMCLCSQTPTATIQKCVLTENVWLWDLVSPSKNALKRVSSQCVQLGRSTPGMVAQPSLACHLPQQTLPTLQSVCPKRVRRTL